MNRLAEETSPYLQQHADNPVDWFPWGEEAFEIARQLDKPVLLSVGYSACHWCHVMAHESFEDPETAQLMNDLFVNVKVDREERPDVDAIYMEATTAMTGHGGWPMTVFMTPDGHPFYCGTYFPPEPRQQMPSFKQILNRVSEAWSEQREEFQQQAQQVTEAVRRSLETQELGRPTPEVASTGAQTGGAVESETIGHVAIDAAVRSLKSRYDPAWGGFGTAPKFPQTMNLELILRAHKRTGDTDLLQIVENCFDCMSSGGLYDHLGGGFARYSVDRQWIVPHFEKMLYDNALLSRLGIHLWQITKKQRYLQVASETITYVLRELRSQEGGFYSAQDADSEGEEGKFYVWTPDEVRQVLGDAGLSEHAEAVCAWYGMTEQGNFEGKNIPWRPQRGDLLRPEVIEQARAALFEHRKSRVPPGLDDKVLTEWNALVLATLSEAAGATQNETWLEAALQNAKFLCENLRREDGRWLRSWQSEIADKPAAQDRRILGYASDYAAVIDAFTRLYEATSQKRWLEVATETADGMLELFVSTEDASHSPGALFTTGSDAEKLVVRPKDTMDNALPSANSAACLGLVRLYRLTHKQDYLDAAVGILKSSQHLAERIPSAFGHLLCAADLLASPSQEIVITGSQGVAEFLAIVHRQYLPNAVLSWGEPIDSPLWQGRILETTDSTPATAYICQNNTCDLPISDPQEFAAKIS